MTKSDKVYIGLCTFFSVLVVVANLTYQKFVALKILSFYTFELSVGAIIYPLIFLITDLIAEFYGKERARFCVNFAVIMNISTAILIVGMDFLPATSWSKIDDFMFHHMFGFFSVAFVASIIACYLAQAVDISLYLWIRKITGGKYLWLRNNGSSAVSLLVDTVIVTFFMVLFGIFSKEHMWFIVMNSYSFKFFFIIASIPLFYLCVHFLKSFLKE